MQLIKGDIKQFRDEMQKFVDVLNEGVELVDRGENGEKIAEEKIEQWQGKFLLALVRLQEISK